METLTLRFAHLSEMIFDHLDNQSIANCNIVSKTWSIYIIEQKFFVIRKIKETVEKAQKLSKPWFEVFKKANTENIMELRNCVKQFYGDGSLKVNCFNKGFTPLHIAAGVGNILLFQSIHKLAENKEPRTDDGFKPVICAIKNGHVKMAEFIIEMSAIENQEAQHCWKVLNLAARFGHVTVCELIMTHIGDKNPKFNLIGGFVVR